MQQAFCAGIKRLAELSKTNFASVVTGQIPNGAAGDQMSSVSLPSSTECYVTYNKGVGTHWCTFPSRPATIHAQTSGMNKVLARCLGVEPPELIDAGDFVVGDVTVSGVKYSVLGNAFDDGTADVSVTVEQDK